MSQLFKEDVQSIKDKIESNKNFIMDNAGDPTKLGAIKQLKKVNPILEKALADIEHGVYGSIKENL